MGVTGIGSVLLVGALTAPEGVAPREASVLLVTFPSPQGACLPAPEEPAAALHEGSCLPLSPSSPKGRGREWKRRTAEKFTLLQGPSPTPQISSKSYQGS